MLTPSNIDRDNLLYWAVLCYLSGDTAGLERTASIIAASEQDAAEANQPTQQEK
jgi:hypothetical protein